MKAAKLSKVQWYILARAAERPGTGRPHYAGSRGPGRADCMMRDLLPAKPTPAQRATLARAVSRLVDRGLVDRVGWCYATETGIILTPAGREGVTKWTAGNYDNRFKGEA